MQLNSSQTIAGNTIWHAGNLNLADDGSNLYYQKKHKIFQTNSKPDVDKGEVLNAVTVNRPNVNRELNVTGDTAFSPKINLILDSKQGNINLNQDGVLQISTQTGQNISFPKVTGTVVTTGNYPQWSDIGGEYYLVKNGNSEIRPNSKDFVTASQTNYILPFTHNSQSIGLSNRKFKEGHFTSLLQDNLFLSKISSPGNNGTTGIQFTENNGFINTNLSGASKNNPQDLILGYDNGVDQKTRNVILNKQLLSKTGTVIIDQDGKIDFSVLKNNNKVDKSGDTLTGNLTFDGFNSSNIIFKTDNQRTGQIKSITSLAGKTNQNEILFKNEGIALKVNDNTILSLTKDQIISNNAVFGGVEAQNVTVNGNLLVRKTIPQNDNQEQAANTKWVRTVAIQEIENLKNTISNNGVQTTDVTVQNQYKISQGSKETQILYDNSDLKINNNQNGNLYYKNRLVYDQSTIPVAQETLKGISMLSSETDSTDKTKAANQFAVKVAFDKAVEQINYTNSKTTELTSLVNTTKSDLTTQINDKVSKTGDTITGVLKFKGNYAAVELYDTQGKYTKLECNPADGDKQLTIAHRNENGQNIQLAYVKKKTGYLAFLDDISWGNLSGKPTTLQGYGITNAVTVGGRGDQQNNKVFIGWNGSRLKATVDNTDLGEFVFQNHLNDLDNRKLNVTGGTISQLDFKDPVSPDYTGFKFFNSTDRYVRIEGLPHTNQNMVQLIYREANGANINVATLRKRTGEIAFKDEINWNVLTGKPQTINGYGITDAVTVNTYQTVTGTKTFNNIRANPKGGSQSNAYNDDGCAFWVNEYNASGEHEYVPLLGGRIRNSTAGWIAGVSFGYESSRANDWGNGVIQFKEDNGKEIRWLFKHNGEFYSPGKMYAGGVMEAQHFHSRNGAYFVGNLDVNDVNVRSDKRLKRNLNKIDNALDKVNRLSGFTYEVNQIGTDIWESSAGIIAQDLKEVLPSAVRIDKNTNYMTVSYNQVIGLLIEAIKELDKKNKKSIFQLV